MTALPEELEPPAGDAESLLAAASALGRVATGLAAGRRRAATAAGRGETTWRGGRSEVFVASATGVGGVLDATAYEVARLAAGLRGLALRLAATEQEVAELRRRALAGADPSACAGSARAARDDYARAAVAFAAQVGSRPPGLDVPPLPDVVVLALARRTPAQVAIWWRALTPDQQAGTLTTYPALVGGLDGLPGWARDRANRLLLQRLEAELRARSAALAAERHGYEPYGAGLWLPSGEAADVAGKLQALAVLRRVLALPDRQLLLLDADQGHELHAAVAVGDVDTARDVAVFVPGMTSSVQASLVAYDAAMVDLRERSGTSTTATVTWLGYDAPQMSDVLRGWLSVGGAHLAKVGGDRLAGFLRGMTATRDATGEEVHLSVLGHSYGSVATGYALRHPDTGVDDVVLFGSPGTSVDDVHDLHVPHGHLWDLTAPGDPVAAVERFGTLPAMMPGFHTLASGPDVTAALAGITGHTHYLDPGTTSQHNIAAVVSGHPEDLVLAPSFDQPEHLAHFR